METTQQLSRTLTAPLRFRPLDLAHLPLVNSVLQASPSRTCDYSIGGMYMWIDRFAYQSCFVDDTLFIKGLSESDPSLTAFMLPVGKMPLADAVELIVDYCRDLGIPPVLSAVPEDRLDDIIAIFPDARVESLDIWSDYLYDINDLASLRGKRFNKKRNHVNRFIADNPGMVLEPITPELIPELSLFFRGLSMREDLEPDPSPAATAAYERQQTQDVLNSFSSFPFTGAVLRAQSGEIAAFTIAEIIADTLFVHIEKARHDIPGAGETINHLFAADMLRRFPALRYANREEDVGDPGLRYAKLSYHPLTLLRKFNLHL